jgi:hypothetical protein
MIDFLQRLSDGDGGAQSAVRNSSGFRELAMVFSKEARQNAHPPHEDNPAHFTCP